MRHGHFINSTGEFVKKKEKKTKKLYHCCVFSQVWIGVPCHMSIIVLHFSLTWPMVWGLTFRKFVQSNCEL